MEISKSTSCQVTEEDMKRATMQAPITGNTNGTLEILNVTGPGRLVSLHLKDLSASPVQGVLTIVLDGKTFSGNALNSCNLGICRDNYLQALTPTVRGDIMQEMDCTVSVGLVPTIVNIDFQLGCQITIAMTTSTQYDVVYGKEI
jgi:hypothetical protein